MELASGERTCVILPAKTFSQGKTRLRSKLTDRARSELARALFQRSLQVSLQCPSVTTTYVVTNGDDVAELARSATPPAQREVLRDPGPGSLANLMDWALHQAWLRGSQRALIIMADLPAVQSADLEAVCSALDACDCVLVPDRRGRSTNAFGLHLPFPGRTAFGHESSLALHRGQARALGLRTRVLSNDRIAHDVDVPEDLGSGPAGLYGFPGDVAQVAGKHGGW